jgi:hypothetical protein
VIFSSKYKFGSSVPTGYVPDPPYYHRCVAYLQTPGGATHAGNRSSAEQLKTQCQREHRMQAESTLGHLIRYAWVYEEAGTRGLTVDAAEIEHEIAKSGVNAAVLNAFGILPSDQEFVVGAELLTRKIFKTLPAYRRLLRRGGQETIKMADEIDNENTKFYNSIEGRWAARTDCEPEFVIPGCSRYSSEGLP